MWLISVKPPRQLLERCNHLNTEQSSPHSIRHSLWQQGSVGLGFTFLQFQTGAWIGLSTSPNWKPVKPEQGLGCCSG